ncbi:MAG: 2TM domain-containing protein [Giesbergeria sp.]
MHDTTSSSNSNLERLAQRRARAKIGWYKHASVYILVNLFLATLSASSGRHWALFPALGWGLGLLLHGVAVWLAMPGGSLYAQLLERERAALQRRQ